MLTTHQLTQHFNAWLQKPAQTYLKNQGGDAREMLRYSVTPQQREFLSAFVVLWDQADVPRTVFKCATCGSTNIRMPADVDPNTMDVEFNDGDTWCYDCEEKLGDGQCRATYEDPAPEPKHDVGLMKTLYHVLFSAERLNQSWYDSGLTDSEYHERMDCLLSGALGAHCGLNADWSGMAWMLSEGVPNLTDRALYFVWADDGDFAIVRRFLDEKEGDQGVEDLFGGRGDDFQSKLKALIEQIEQGN